MRRIGTVAMVLGMLTGCMGGAEPVCVQLPGDPPARAVPRCDGAAPEGYEWRPVCDSGGGEYGSRYVGCGIDEWDGHVVDRWDEAAVCLGSEPVCRTGDTIRCALVPCDGRTRIPSEV